jgi:hypothetical protein
MYIRHSSGANWQFTRACRVSRQHWRTADAIESTTVESDTRLLYTHRCCGCARLLAGCVPWRGIP